ncbi:MAG: type I glutamate--ammonia ligase [Anaerolineaceae bacterium]|nr:type I glutamate--ammonia ligase [Anaerolineae bacterium]MCB9458287.1 type I glutamate--ammonia ligase [Anaerolineaceae bacterium]
MSYTLPDSAKESPAALLSYAKEQGVIELDLRFTDIRGMVQHFSMPLSMVDAGDFEEGFGFDGSSVRGFQTINVSDMILFPDLSTAIIDPFFSAPTVAIKCDVSDPITREPYANDPRGIARRAEEYLKSTGIGDVAYFGPEAEFFLFTNVRYETEANKSYYEVDSHEAFWNTASPDPAMNYLNRIKEGYFPLPPLDKTQDVRSDMVQTMMAAGIDIEVHHHEVGGAGQAEIDMRFDTLLRMADKVLDYKYIVKNVAAKYGLIATFMPKPLFKDNGSGMHVHQSIWKGGKPLFGGDQYAGLSQMALWYIGGVLKHAQALLALTNPTTNSYRRLVPGYEAPVNLVYSARNRSAAIRIPMYSNSPKAKRVETRFPDPTANPYLALPALLMAGLDGIKNQIDPGNPFEMDLYESEDVETPTTPPTLGGALQALAADHDFLLEGGVFTKEYLEMYIDYKQTEEADQVAMRPHPYEFNLYLDF